MNQAGHLKSTFKHTFIYSSATFLQKGAGFIMLPIYAHYLRGEGYGIVGMIDVVLSVMTVAVGYGLLDGMQRFYFEKKNDHDRNVLISTTIFVTFFCVLAVCVPVYLFKGELARIAFGRTDLEYYLTLAIATFIADMTAQCAGGYMMIKQQSVAFSLLSILKFAIAISLNIYLIVVCQLGVLGFLYSGLISGVIYSLVLHCHAFHAVGFHFSKAEATDLLKFNLPLIPGFFAQFFRNNIDRIILRSFLGLSQVGAYNMLLKFSTLIILFFLQPFLRIWGVKRLEICDQPDGELLIAKVFTLQLALMLFAGLILAVEIPLILRIMAPPEFWVPGTYAFLAVAAKILFGSYYHLNFGLIYAKKTFLISKIQMIAALISIVSNVVFIAALGFVGALISAVLVFLGQCIMTHMLARKYYRIPFEWKKITSMVTGLTFLFFAIDSFSMSGLHLDNYVTMYLKPAVVALTQLFALDEVGSGKLFLSVLENLPLLTEGGFKFLLCFSFILWILYLDVVTKKQILKPLTFLKSFVGMKKLLV